MPVLGIVAAGFAAVQDLGRPGHAHTGVGANGAADAGSAARANVLVGNAPGAALIEITGSALRISVDRPVLAAITGAAEELTVDGSARPAREPVVATSSLEVPAPRRGQRSYLAVNGRLDVPGFLGSVAPDPLLGVGRTLRAGESLQLDSAFTGVVHPWLPLFRFGVPPPLLDGVVDVTTGPDAGEFPSLAGELAGTFSVSADSDHMGLRLAGTAPRRATSTELLSRGVPVGAVQVPPTGGVIVLLRGRLLTAGYPIVAVATTLGVDVLGQLRPGDPVRFRPVSLEAAVRALHVRSAALDDLATRVHRAYAACGLATILPA